jgi:peptidoglycan/xylan/chitin deacetylase (PgdA/CDA1 family)
MTAIVLHALASAEPLAPLRGVTGCFDRVVAEVSGDESVLDSAAAGLPRGAATAEAIAVRLRRSGSDLRWGAPTPVADTGELLDRCRDRGRSSVEIWRADPSLLIGLQLGAWFDAPWRPRALRRGLVGLRVPQPALRWTRRLTLATDLAFWSGVRERATPEEWFRLSGSSYVALIYHRFAGELAPGQDRIDIAPGRFVRQLRTLWLAGFRPIAAQQIGALHAGAGAPAKGRRVSITVDDALADCVEPLLRQAHWAPQLFVPTRELGGAAHWIGGEPVATWEDVQTLADAGVAIGSHARRHQRLTPLGAAERQAELAGSLADLRRRLSVPVDAVAFPHGDHDRALCDAARAAGYRLAYTTEKGRNGAGTDPHSLRRVSIHGHDGALAVLWKAQTGEGLPALWLQLRTWRLRLLSRRRRRIVRVAGLATAPGRAAHGRLNA